MFKRTKVCLGVLAALGGVGMLATQQATAQTVERVEITGTSIKRIDAEAAVPVVVLKAEDIARSGATSVVDLLQRLPAIQGAVGQSASVGGQTFGFSGASVHDLGEQRTLVLLNGHRLALFGGQTLTGFAAGFDLNAIPVSAIERVEVLTDGASALYGSDAVAGVVNFITKRGSKDGDVTIGYSAPKGGAKETRFSLTKGFGDLGNDGFNVLLSYAHDERTLLKSTDRDFAKTGRVFFSENGKNYRFQQFSASPIPANVVDDNGLLTNPYLVKNGACPEKTFRVTDADGDYCGFDFVGELEIYPTRKRDAAFGSVNVRIGDHDLFGDILTSQTKVTSRIAPVPGSLSIPTTSPLFDKYLAPIGITQDTIAFYRVYDLGKRTTNDTADFLDIALGSKGSLFNWDYTAAYTHSESKAKENLEGYPGALALSAVRKSGLLDPFVLAGQQTPEAQAALNAVNYHGYWDGGKSTLDSVFVRASGELAKLPAGSLSLGTGVNFNKEKFQSNPSLFAQGKLADPVAGTLCDPNATPAIPCDQRFGDSATTIPYGADRKTWGLFGELIIPALKELEFSIAARHDHYSDFGSADTAKGTFRWNVTKDVLLRGSVGTGYHAPTVPQVAAAPQPFGVTSDKYSCATTPELKTVADSLGAQCRPGSAQYDVVAAGNPLLKPEKSKQATLGLRVDPVEWLSLGADLWHVEIKDTFGQLPERTVFGSPLSYPGSWTKKLDIATGVEYLTFNAGNLNLGKSFSTGLDLDFTARAKTSIGEVTSQLNATYMIREVAQQVIDGPYYSSVGDYGENVGGATFRWQGKWITTLKTGPFSNTLQINYKSGYRDAAQDAEVLDASGNPTGATDSIRLKIPAYYTFDWQGQYDWDKSFSFVFGVLNLADKKPPFSISTGGTNRGQQFGYDDRYYSPLGRTWYVNASYKF